MTVSPERVLNFLPSSPSTSPKGTCSSDLVRVRLRVRTRVRVRVRVSVRVGVRARARVRLRVMVKYVRE